MNARTLPGFSLASYLAWEDDQPERHQFYRGEIVAMVGARRVHGTVVGNLAAEWRTQLKGSPSRVFDMSDAEALEAPSIGVRVPLAGVFDGVERPSADATAPPVEDD